MTTTKEFDHLVVGAPSLRMGIQWLSEKLGIEPMYGGEHVGRGTANLILGLEGKAYLEVIAPSDSMGALQSPRESRLRRLKKPELMRWVVRSTGLEVDARRLQGWGLIDDSLLAITTRRRDRLDGDVLRWKLLANGSFSPSQCVDGLLPIFIHWTNGEHPSVSAPAGARMLSLWGEHPRADDLIHPFRDLGLNLELEDAVHPHLKAIVEGPRGEVLLSTS